LLNLAQKLSTGQRGSIAGLSGSFEADKATLWLYKFGQTGFEMTRLVGNKFNSLYTLTLMIFTVKTH